MVSKEKINAFLAQKSDLLAIATAIAGTITIVFCSIYYYAMDPSFSFTSHWISHLGAGPTARPNASSVVFTIGLIITGILALPFLYHLYSILKPELTKHKALITSAYLFSIVSIAGLFINAIWNMGDNPELHVSGSSIFFFGGLFMILLFALAFLLNNKYSKVQGWISLIVASTFFAFLISYLPFVFQGVDLMVLLTSTDPRAGTTRFIEWIVFFAVIFWFLELGFFFNKLKKVQS